MISIMDIVQDGKIFISPDDWCVLNKAQDKDYIKNLISKAIDKYNVPLPMRDIDLHDALTAYKDLCDFDVEKVILKEEWFTRYAYDPKYTRRKMILKSLSVGGKASDYFQQHNRWKCDSINSPSPYRSWTIEKFRMTLLNALWSLKVNGVDTKTLRSCISLRKYIASQFRPSVAKAVYDLFEAKHVLDFSSGWGDRLVGFMASNALSYTGVDPNKYVYADYFNMMNTLGCDKEVHLFNDCAENMVYEKDNFDLVFTSPPYFNIERYTQEDNQSFKKYRKLDDWLNEFLFKAIESSWNGLKSGGHMVINISDVYSNHTVNKICDPMNDFISKLTGAEYKGCIGYEMRKRPNSKALVGKTGRFGEPMWVWKKR